MLRCSELCRVLHCKMIGVETAANVIDLSHTGTNAESCFIYLLPHDGVSLCLHSALMMLLGRWGGVFIFTIRILYCSPLSLEGQKDGSDHVAARHLEGEILNVISVRWHKNSSHVVSDQKPSGGEAAVEGGGLETSAEKHITQRPILFSRASTERGFILTMCEWNVLRFSKVEKLLFHLTARKNKLLIGN